MKLTTKYNSPKQPTDFVTPSERTSPGRAQYSDTPPTWLGYLVLGLFTGFLLGTSFALFL